MSWQNFTLLGAICLLACFVTIAGAGIWQAGYEQALRECSENPGSFNQTAWEFRCNEMRKDAALNHK